MTWRVRLCIAAAILLATPLRPAEATIATASVAVSANVTTYCSITAAALPFGNYTGAVLQATSSVTVNCTNALSYTVGLDQGQNFTTTRTMLLSGNNLSYGLFTDAAYSNAWGNASGSWVIGTGTGSAQTLTVYGSIPAGQNVPTGTYTDLVTATVTY